MRKITDDAMLIEEDERDAYGQYQIESSRTLIFPFTVPFLKKIKLAVSHIYPNSQDHSIMFWLSKKPLDDMIFLDGIGNLNLSRRPNNFIIEDVLLGLDGEFALPSNVVFYANVKNLQNRVNAFQLLFDIMD